ncbi:MAG: hypothetical protein ACXWC5_29820, partial [Burkholderiales bacterium]
IRTRMRLSRAGIHRASTAAYSFSMPALKAARTHPAVEGNRDELIVIISLLVRETRERERVSPPRRS